MTSWEVDLLASIDGYAGQDVIFRKLQAAARNLGFEHCAYGLRMPWPLSNPRTLMLNDYPAAWQARYFDAGYLDIDPTVLHGRRTQQPLAWSDELFEATPRLWEEARSFGLRVGWFQSSLSPQGVGGMLTLARSADPLTDDELQAKDLKLRWLVNVAHLSLLRTIAPSQGTPSACRLTDREVEVLKWTGDGKTSGEISDILALSIDTVNFHVKNAVAKLGVSNKTAAVVRAAMCGLLA